MFVEASTRANSTAIFEALRFEAGTRQADRLSDLIEDCARDASATTLLQYDSDVAIGRKLAGLAGKTQASAERYAASARIDCAFFSVSPISA